MVTKTIDITEARSRLPELLELVIAGTEVIIMADDQPLARLSPVAERQKRIAGLNAGAAWISDDFDAPLPDEFWAGES